MARGHIAVDQIDFAPGTYTPGNAVTTNSDGQLVDGGTPPGVGALGSGGFTVNGSATVSVNGAAVSFNDTVLVNGVAI